MQNRLKFNQASRASMDDGFSVRVVDSVPSVPQVSIAVQQVASQLGIEPLAVLRLIARGELPAINIEGRYHIDDADLRAAMRTIRRWKLPSGLLQVDYVAERKVRERLLKFAKLATSDAVILAEAKRLLRPGTPIESVGPVTLEFRSGPAGFVNSLADASNRGEFTVSIRGEETQPTSTVGYDFARSRLMAGLNRQYDASMSKLGDKSLWLYSSPEVYRSAVTAALERVRGEVLTARETRLVTVSVKTLENGATVQRVEQRVPINVTYMVPVSAFGLPLDRVARESL